MGGLLVSAVWADSRHKRLGRAARLVLLRAAHLCRDADARTPEGARYWAGSPILADALGYTLPEEPDAEDTSPEAADARTLHRNAERAVRAAWQEIRRAGMAERIRAGQGHHRTEHRLTLELSASRTQAETEPPPQAETEPPLRRRLSHRSGGGSATALGEVRNLQRNTPGTIAPQASTSPASRRDAEQEGIERAALEKLGPNHYPRYLERAQADLGQDAPGSEVVRHALALARGGAA
ncbi:hypothetical protein GCM10025865_09240 [Paraoerskovia sediminicola]|uniref:Uncharacterized protein n=1 Tax=Paraoerskovia sediminicola TaxID=1138587 RepID=A0ABM8G0S0_9CELL|nr:hypothetical protein GCM10025865_09240 [Paraoerskovia sediminicola]